MTGSSEHAEQAAVIQWARYNSGKWPILNWLHSTPNGAALARRKGSVVSMQAMKLKAEGMTAGVSDLFLPAARCGYHGIWLEMKWGRNTLTNLQEEFIDAVEAEGYFAVVCYSANEAIDILEKYLSGDMSHG